MDKPFFVMIHNQRGTAVLPLRDGDEVAMFETVEEAKEAATVNDMCDAFGYDVFEAGCGIDGDGGSICSENSKHPHPESGENP